MSTTLRQTYSFRLDAANIGKLHRLQTKLAERQNASAYVLDQLKLLVIMQSLPRYEAGSVIYHQLRERFPSLNSKAAQQLIKDVVSSTLAVDRDKLLRTSTITATLAYDNQCFDIQTDSTGHRSCWLQLGSSRSGIRLPLSGRYPSGRLASVDIISIDSVRIYQRLRKNRPTLFASISCTVRVPELSVVDSVDQVLAIDQNIKRITGSNGKHWKLGPYLHMKRMLRAAQLQSGGPQSLAGNQYFNNWSRDYWRKQAKAIADYATANNFAAIAVEDLAGILKSARSKRASDKSGTIFKGKAFNWMLHGQFPFAMFQQFLERALARVGVRFVKTNPSYTSQTCSACGKQDRKARRSQARFACTDADCGHVQHADANAAANIRRVVMTHAGLVAPAPIQVLEPVSETGMRWMEDPIACNG